MAMLHVVMYTGSDDYYTTEMTEEQYHRLVGQGVNSYGYGGVLEIYYEYGYMKHDCLTGEVIKAVYFCQ